MEFKGTKGTWEVSRTEGYFEDIYCGETEICSLIFSDVTDDERLRNAKLIAAAPEMLKIISSLANIIEENDLGYLFAINRVKEVIKKATE